MSSPMDLTRQGKHRARERKNRAREVNLVELGIKTRFVKEMLKAQVLKPCTATREIEH